MEFVGIGCRSDQEFYQMLPLVGLDGNWDYVEVRIGRNGR
jgi:hypothetical protein